MLREHAFVVAAHADGVDAERRARAHREPARDVAALDRVRDEHGVGADEGGCRGQRIDERHGEGGVGAAESRREHDGSAELARGGGEVRVRGLPGDDEGDRCADADGGAEEARRRLGELTGGRDVQQDEDRVRSEINHDDSLLRPDGSR